MLPKSYKLGTYRCPRGHVLDADLLAGSIFIAFIAPFDVLHLHVSLSEMFGSLHSQSSVDS